jgi:hypothetical protein
MLLFVSLNKNLLTGGVMSCEKKLVGFLNNYYFFDPVTLVEWKETIFLLIVDVCCCDHKKKKSKENKVFFLLIIFSAFALSRALYQHIFRPEIFYKFITYYFFYLSEIQMSLFIQHFMLSLNIIDFLYLKF